MNETALGKRICLLASELGCRIFRQNTGQGWVGESVRFSKEAKVVVYPGDVIIRKARPLHAGLCTGSSDYIGWKSMIITSSMVGKLVAVFIAPEIKTPTGRVREEQVAFIEAVNKAGGIAGICRSEEDGFELLS